MTSGATSDLRQATRLARHMVVDCGMSDAIGPGAGIVLCLRLCKMHTVAVCGQGVALQRHSSSCSSRRLRCPDSWKVWLQPASCPQPCFFWPASSHILPRFTCSGCG